MTPPASSTSRKPSSPPSPSPPAPPASASASFSQMNGPSRTPARPVPGRAREPHHRHAPRRDNSRLNTARQTHHRQQVPPGRGTASQSTPNRASAARSAGTPWTASPPAPSATHVLACWPAGLHPPPPLQPRWLVTRPRPRPRREGCTGSSSSQRRPRRLPPELRPGLCAGTQGARRGHGHDEYRVLAHAGRRVNGPSAPGRGSFVCAERRVPTACRDWLALDGRGAGGRVRKHRSVDVFAVKTAGGPVGCCHDGDR
jgi:hypothetical protein